MPRSPTTHRTPARPPLLRPALDLADTLEARIEANDPLSPAEWLGVVNTLRSIANDWRIAAEFMDGVAGDAWEAAQGARVVSLRPALAVIAGGLS
jgi:hypothetical protein